MRKRLQRNVQKNDIPSDMSKLSSTIITLKTWKGQGAGIIGFNGISRPWVV